MSCMPASVIVAFVARRSSGHGKRWMSPRSSSRRATCERRGSVAFVREASSVMRIVRSGASPRAMSTPYSKWVRPASRRSCASSAPGSSSASATRRTQAADSSVFSHFVSLMTPVYRIG